MELDYSIELHTLKFIKPAKTSRNVFKEKKHWIIKLWDKSHPECIGIGEAAPLEFLSPDFNDDFEEKLTAFLQQLVSKNSLAELDLENYPAIKFALESALIDLQNGGRQEYFHSDFLTGRPILINGLVWMNDLVDMYDDAISKVESGYQCIKFKVGQHDFDTECRFIEKFRQSEQGKNIILRLDANGAFEEEHALEKLKELQRFDIQSIEQPIKAGNWDGMAKLCKDSKMHIALDEELIGVTSEMRKKLLHSVKPDFIVLKPTLLGGFSQCEAWIDIANKCNIDWWATSALESNYGLNAIAQWVGKCNTTLHQGLGTGLLYKTNFEPRSEINAGQLFYKN